MAAKKPSKRKWNRLVAAALATAAISGTGYFTLQHKNNSLPVPAYTIARVIDGDTMETTEKQLVRVANIMAPELEHCGGPEAKATLEKLVLGKPVYFKALFRDQYQRLDSLVYTNEGFVNLKMVADGSVQYHISGKTTPESEAMKAAGEQAREQNLGIYSKCVETENKAHPKCIIKGNKRDGRSFYHIPGCAQYNNTKIEKYLGDEWFCTEQEARKAGFTKADLCP